MSKFLLPLSEFNRLHQVIHGAIRAEGKRRSKQRPTMTIGSNDGIIRELNLPETVARGAW